MNNGLLNVICIYGEHGGESIFKTSEHKAENRPHLQNKRANNDMKRMVCEVKKNCFILLEIMAKYVFSIRW